MSVYLPPRCKTYRYRFLDKGRWHRGTTGQLRKADALLWESQYKLRLRQEAGGIAPFDPSQTPHIQRWAEVYFREAKKKVARPERIKDLVRGVLRFWGARPAANAGIKIIATDPYHNLHLADPIADPYWLQVFEEWMEAKGWSGQTKNQHRSVMTQMYALAITPIWRTKTKIQVNPFLGIPRDVTMGREVAMTAEELRRFVAAATYHVRLAVAIGALAPKLRLANILELRWAEHLDADLTYITVRQHKTVRKVRRPLVIPISDQLRRILEDAKPRSHGGYVVTYRGEPVTEIRGGIKGACVRAGLPYGRKAERGITFHVLRHTAATTMAELDISEEKRRQVMGHAHLSTTQKYTHLRPRFERSTVEELSAALPLEDLVTLARIRAPKVERKADPIAENERKKSSKHAHGSDRRKSKAG